ncbi:MAG: 6,7-dimethyl-8-ribityllumazine synthase, partial [Acidobacteria bacterium]|nr:6,7-dimethyl-8-ribityllumazine synthase [Acidobacteriota bacterium]
MPYRFAIVASSYNSVIVDRLVAGAKRALKGHDPVNVIRVPGSFEIPLAAKQAALSKKYDGIVALGCVLRGETPHFDYISTAVSGGLSQAALETGIPIGFGVLTVNTVEQAMERSGE